MLFKTAGLKTEYPDAHPVLRKALGELELQLSTWGFPELTITQIFRSPEQQEALYWESLLERHMTEEEARAAARRKFSWHLLRCAADIRNSVYTARQLFKILEWLAVRCPSPEWEVLNHDVGHGTHLHVAVRDFSKRRRTSA